MADSDAVTATPDDAGDLSPGATLRKAREARETSIQDVADELHLDSWMLEALERNDFAALGAPVFAKGHLRQYAKVLGVDQDDLMVAYYNVCGPREQPPLLADSTLRAEGRAEQSFSWLWPMLIALVVISAIGVSIYLWMQPTAQPASISGEVTQFDVPLTETEAVPTGEAKIETPPPAVVEEPQQVTGDTVESLLIPAVPDTEEAGLADSAAGSIVSNNLMITMRFRGESWVEVYDAKRQKLLYGLVDAATVKYLSGPPPVSVFIGSQNDVSIEVNGEAFAVPRQAIKGKTARFQIDAPE
ncbi:MAG: helix-turn-helix domain-containing protein [Gammaproteobacteria bacterium]|nr:helix-turn-helix domain-containing protein [Gammaproteobacteria bacterium]